MFDNFSTNLRNLRRNMKMSQEELASLVGYSSKNISKWENGKSFPDVQTLKILCDIFDIKTINILCDTLIPFSFLNHHNDIKIINKYNLNFNEFDINIFYILIECSNNLMFEIEIYDELFNSLSKFKKYGLIEEFNILITEDTLIVEYKDFSKIKNKSFGELILDIESNKVNLSNDAEYYNYIDSLGLPKQYLIVLDFIDKSLPLSFTISDLYNESLVLLLKNLYPKNKDIRKIIRTAISKLVEVNLLIKNGYSKYKKVHHKLTENFMLNDSLLQYFNKKIYIDITNDYKIKILNYKFDDFKEFISCKNELLIAIVNYFLHLRNISLLESFTIYTKESLFDNEYIVIDEKIELDIMIEYM